MLLGRQQETPQYPQDLYLALHDLAAQFPGKPIYVTENGMPTDNGKPRADRWTRSRALSDSVYWVQRAWADGIDVRGYQYWSLTDNFEWGSYSPRFGLGTVDVLTDPTLTRRPTDAVATYTAITRRRGTPEGYKPTLIRCSDSGRALTCPDAPDPPQVRWAAAEPTAAHRPKFLAPALTVTLRVHRSGRRTRLTATVRASGIARVGLSLRRASITVKRKTVRIRAGRATATFVVRRPGNYWVTAFGTGLRARSQIVRIRSA
ncbi:MAG TPA: family 1 glycosylhydrolase [Solirubrobacteraceae bacterium]|nr:family 1 glycosylhydrolase [Solirubrobacteraceae bacterium]